MIYSMSLDFTKIEYINPVCLDILGYTPAEVYQQSALFSSAVHPDDRPYLAQKTAELLVHGERRCEVRIVHKDGTVKHVTSYGRLKRDANGTPISITGVISDITEKKMAELKVQEAADKVSNILESLLDGFFAVDKNNIITYVNKKYEDLFRCKRGQLIGKYIDEALPWGNGAAFQDIYQQVIAENGSANFESYSEALNSWFYVSVYANEDGVAVYLTDITERKKSEQVILDQNQQLRKIAWVQSHKVRAPLARIMGLIVIFNYGNVDDPENLRVLSLIKEEADNLDAVISEVVHLTHSAGLLTDQNSSGNDQLALFQ
jgi:PAS domain S-box-containing protein